MSTALVRAEIERFLKSSETEVLCIKGKWGVGKTFAWLRFLHDVEKERALGLGRYAYISLFGINSLEALKYSIFENTVSAGQIKSGPDVSTLRSTLERAGTIGRKAKPLYGTILSALGIKDAGEALSRAAFLSVRKQIVCLDDLERAGASLQIRDVLGLVSMLKEQRNCKIVLLLNDEQLGEEGKEEFQRLLEKVVDVSLVFDPTPEEAVGIALAAPNDIGSKLGPKIIQLGITNIRVIKKIERLASRLTLTLGEFREEIIDQAIATVTLAGWCVFQPDNAPTADFLRDHNALLTAMREDDENLSQQDKDWAETLTNYGYGHSDELDLEIIDGVIAGYFNDEKLLVAADSVRLLIEHNGRNNSFSKAWDLYHHSLVTDDDEILDALYNGLKENIATISPLNFNATILLFREFGRGDQASELIPMYVAGRSKCRNDLEDELRMWGREKVDDELLEAFKKVQEEFVDQRDPKEVLIQLGDSNGWNNEDVQLLAQQTTDDYEKIFEEIQGDNLSRLVKRVLSIGRHEKETQIEEGATAALKRIAAKSPLKARRVASYGVKLEEADETEGEAG